MQPTRRSGPTAENFVGNICPFSLSNKRNFQTKLFKRLDLCPGICRITVALPSEGKFIIVFYPPIEDGEHCAGTRKAFPPTLAGNVIQLGLKCYSQLNNWGHSAALCKYTDMVRLLARQYQPKSTKKRVLDTPKPLQTQTE